MYGFCGNTAELLGAAATLQAWITDTWDVNGGTESDEPTVEVSVISYAATVSVDDREIWNSEFNEEEPVFSELLKLLQAECRNWAMFAETNP